MPGVLAVAASPNLQQPLEATTSPNGDYTLPFLPAGDYTVTFALDGFRPVTETLRLAVGDTVTINVRMQIGIEEAVTVRGDVDDGLLSSTPTVAMNHSAELVNQLPLDRSLRASALLAPNVSDNGPLSGEGTNEGRVSISGAMSFENLYLVNGAVVNENLSGQDLPLYVEDAIQEITTSSSAISAEYGHFNGGIVNVVTKSGGNDPSGSFRTTFTNDSWRATTPFGEPKADQTVPTYEVTFGGPIQRRRVWFFLAGRYNDTTTARQTRFTEISYEADSRDSRFEGKVTYTPLPAHTIRASYFTFDNQRTNVTGTSGGVLDLASLMDTGDKQDLVATHYTGALSSRMFVEAQFSQRRRRVRFGSTDTDLITGTLVIDQLRNGGFFGAPNWCAVCGDDSERDNQSILVKGNYFLSSERLGSHDLIAGYNTYNDRYVEDNHQSGTSFGIVATSLIRDQNVFPVYRPFQTLILQRPVTAPTLGSDFRVHSFFINDRAQINRHLSLNLGLRHDRNHARDSIRRLVSNDSKWSPRLALAYSPDGTGRWGLTTGFARYVSRVNTNFGNAASPGGRFSSFVWFYLGPTVNGNPNAPTESLVFRSRERGSCSSVSRA